MPSSPTLYLGTRADVLLLAVDPQEHALQQCAGRVRSSAFFGVAVDVVAHRWGEVKSR